MSVGVLRSSWSKRGDGPPRPDPRPLSYWNEPTNRGHGREHRPRPGRRRGRHSRKPRGSKRSQPGTEKDCRPLGSGPAFAAQFRTSTPMFWGRAARSRFRASRRFTQICAKYSSQVSPNVRLVGTSVRVSLGGQRSSDHGCPGFRTRRSAVLAPPRRNASTSATRRRALLARCHSAKGEWTPHSDALGRPGSKGASRWDVEATRRVRTSGPAVARLPADGMHRQPSLAHCGTRLVHRHPVQT